MKNGEGSTSSQRVVYEYDFFDENRTGPIRTHLVPIGREMKKQRVVYEYDFFNKNRTGPVRTHLVPIGREAVTASRRRRRDAQPLQPQFNPAEAEIVFEKTLVDMDLWDTLFVREIDRVMWFLREEERREVEGGGGFLEVETVDPSGNGYVMRLKRSLIFAGVAEMSGEWSKLVRVNGLKEGDYVYGWGYRKDGRFCIAIKCCRKLT